MMSLSARDKELSGPQYCSVYIPALEPGNQLVAEALHIAIPVRMKRLKYLIMETGSPDYQETETRFGPVRRQLNCHARIKMNHQDSVH